MARKNRTKAEILIENQLLRNILKEVYKLVSPLNEGDTNGLKNPNVSNSIPNDRPSKPKVPPKKREKREKSQHRPKKDDNNNIREKKPVDNSNEDVLFNCLRAARAALQNAPPVVPVVPVVPVAPVAADVPFVSKRPTRQVNAPDYYGRKRTTYAEMPYKERRISLLSGLHNSRRKKK